MRGRGGFALLTVLWVIGGLGALLEGAAIAQSNLIRSAQNRIDWRRGYWNAQGCARRAESVAANALKSEEVEVQTAAWRRLDALIVDAPALNGCDVALEAAGTRLDVNGASRVSLERAFSNMPEASRFDQLADRIVAIRDSVPFVDLRQLIPLAAPELSDAAITEIDRLLSIERGRVSLATASAEVLATVPGFSDEAARVLTEYRRENGPIGDLTDVLPLLSPTDRAELVESFPDARRATTSEPDAWIVVSKRVIGQRSVPVELHWRWSRTPDGVSVVSGWIVK